MTLYRYDGYIRHILGYNEWLDICVADIDYCSIVK